MVPVTATVAASESVAKARAALAIVDLGRFNMAGPLVDERAKDEKSAPKLYRTCDPHINRAFVRRGTPKLGAGPTQGADKGMRSNGCIAFASRRSRAVPRHGHSGGSESAEGKGRAGCFHGRWP